LEETAKTANIYYTRASSTCLKPDSNVGTSALHTMGNTLNK